MINVRRLGEIAVLGALLIVAWAGHASTTIAQSTAIRISPPNFELSAEPGQVVAQEIVISNQGEGDLPITMTASGFVPAGTQGQPALSDQQVDVVDWTSVSPKEFMLKPGQRQTVTFLINVPANAPPGGHYLSILASLGTGQAQAGSVSVGQQIGSLVLLTVAGEVIEDIEISSFSAPSFVSKGPINFTVLARNIGNVHVRPTGVITVKDTFGGEVIQLQLAPANVLPNSGREFQATWDTGWNIGRFKAEYIGFYGADNKQATASVTFIIFPVADRRAHPDRLVADRTRLFPWPQAARPHLPGTVRRRIAPSLFR